MSRRVQAHKVGPTSLAARSGATRTNHKNPSHVVLRGQASKLPPQVPTALALMAGEPHDFICAWCGTPNPWSRMEGHDRHLKFCTDCISLMDQIELSTTGAYE